MGRGLIILLVFCLWGHMTAQAATLDEVRARGVVNCGVDEQHYGFAFINEEGEWAGFEVDFCRALAAAIFHDAQKVSFVPLNSQTRFSALHNKMVDVLFRSTTWNFRRDASYGLDFPNITYYDHLAILAHKSVEVDRLDQVDQARLCVAASTTTHETVRAYVKDQDIDIEIKVFNSREGLNNFFFSGQCDLYAADHSALYSILVGMSPNPENYKFLNTKLAKEPLGPVVRENDREWFEIVKWLVFAMVEAEERGITKENLDRMRASASPEVLFMLGLKPGLGQSLRLEDDWLASVIASVGNYGEVFERHLGKDSPVKMDRGLNALWSQGGLMYSVPIR